jgi:hypothetical protein
MKTFISSLDVAYSLVVLPFALTKVKISFGIIAFEYLITKGFITLNTAIREFVISLVLPSMLIDFIIAHTIIATIRVTTVIVSSINLFRQKD